MNASVAITAIISERAVELVAIVTGGWLIRSAIPQLRMSAPREAPKAAAEPSPAAALDGQKQEAAQ